MQMRIPIIAGNWKMHKTVAEACSFVEAAPRIAEQIDVVICAPFTALHAIKQLAEQKNIALGAQNVHWEEAGAFTGEISPLMLKELGVKYVIVGHSERRAYFNETNETVSKRIHAALQHGLTPIACVGEDLPTKEAGQTAAFLHQQMQAVMQGLSAEAMQQVVVAYEPIWAIGTGRTSSFADANAMITTIRGYIQDHFNETTAEQTRIQYGGSVKPENIAGFLKQSAIDGALIGGASLDLESFLAMVKGVQ
jgi:triosephosphate isomerase